MGDAPYSGIKIFFRGVHIAFAVDYHGKEQACCVVKSFKATWELGEESSGTDKPKQQRLFRSGSENMVGFRRM